MQLFATQEGRGRADLQPHLIWICELMKQLFAERPTEGSPSGETESMQLNEITSLASNKPPLATTRNFDKFQ